MTAHYCFVDDFDGKAFTCHCPIGENHYKSALADPDPTAAIVPRAARPFRAE